jgi:hypothetical protein
VPYRTEALRNATLLIAPTTPAISSFDPMYTFTMMLAGATLIFLGVFYFRSADAVARKATARAMQSQFGRLLVRWNIPPIPLTYRLQAVGLILVGILVISGGIQSIWTIPCGTVLNLLRCR